MKYLKNTKGLTEHEFSSTAIAFVLLFLNEYISFGGFRVEMIEHLHDYNAFVTPMVVFEQDAKPSSEAPAGMATFRLNRIDPVAQFYTYGLNANSPSKTDFLRFCNTLRIKIKN